MTRVILIRHGQTQWNNDLKYQGHSDVDLSETGIRQAELVGRRLANEPIHAVYASDLSRALQTAQSIANPHGLPVNPLVALREFHFGEWEGLTHAQISQRWPVVCAGFFKNPDEIRVPGGETFGELKLRAQQAVDAIVARHPDQTIAVISHGGTIRTIICAALGIHLNRVWGIRLDNTAVNVIEYYKDSCMLTLLNDTHHLAAE